MKLVAKIMGLAMVLSLVAMGTSFADENEVVALKGEVNDLNKKIATLENQMTAIQNRPAAAEPSTHKYVSTSEQGGGLIHTMQDINMSGFVDVQYNNNFSNHTSNVGGNPLRSFDANQNTFTVNQVDMIFSKTANPEGGAGFLAEIMMGEDAQTVESATFGSGSTAVSTNSDRFSLVQGYIQYVAPLKFIGENDIFADTIDIKAGRMVTLAGVEVIRATDNWNVSRGLLFGLAIPFTHTGVRGEYKLFNDKVTTYFGVNNGWDNVIDNNTWKTWETGLSFSPLENVTTTSVIYFGPEGARQEGHKRFLWSNVIGWDATDRLSFKGEFDLGTQRRVALANGNFENAQWWGLGAFSHYKLTDKLGASYRIEYFRDTEQSRTDPAFGLTRGSDTTWEQTLGADYELAENLTGRLEYRFDKSNAENPFNGDSSQSTLGAEMIYKFA